MKSKMKENRNIKSTFLPRTPEDLTPEWLTLALGERFPGIKVTRADIVEIILGTAVKVRMRVSYAKDLGPNSPPQTLCVKGGLDERLRWCNTASIYQNEANFFRHLAPELNTPLPRWWYAESDDENGIVIFDDMIAAGARFWKPTEPWSSEMLCAALESLAALHAATWNIDTSKYPWLKRGAPHVLAILPAMFGDDNWGNMLKRPDARFIPAAQRDRERMKRAFDALWELYDRDTPCLVHYDPHIGNTYIDTNGQPWFGDWACVSVVTYMHDVAYLITGALSVSDRRAHERDILAHYLHSLEEHGGPSLSFEDAWLDYRRLQIYGFIWAMVPVEMQPADIVAAFTERHVIAIEDHGTLAAMGV